MPHLCFYVSGHGLGHAARVQAVVEELLALADGDSGPRAQEGAAERRNPWCVELRTSAPSAAFDLLRGAAAAAPHGRCTATATRVALDPGVIQTDSFLHDLDATLAAWRSLLAQASALADEEAAHLAACGAALVASDASPLPFLAARRAGVGCLLLGNFTWDWILEGYLAREPAFAGPARELTRLYELAELYLRLPMSPEPPARLPQRRLPLISRRAVRARDELRALLGIAPEERMVLLCFGGFGARDLSLEALARRCPPDLRCVWDQQPARPPQLITAAGLGLRYSDLMRAADAVFTKPGFSTIADAVAQCTPLAYVPRDGFRESPLLEAYLEELGWPRLRLPYETLASGAWAPRLRAWLDEPRAFPEVPVDGAAQAAAAIREHCRV